MSGNIRPFTGRTLSVRHVDELRERLEALEPIPGDGQPVDQGPSGTFRGTPRRGARGRAARRDSFPAKIVSGGPIDYTCDLYENGKDSSPTQSGVTVELLSLNIGETIPTGTWVIVCRTAVALTGGS